MASTSTDNARVFRRMVLFAALLAPLAACTQPAAPVAPPAGPIVYAPRIVLTIQFNFDSAVIRPEYYPTLDNLAAGLGDPSLMGAQFDINGHTDIIGRFGYNVALSMRRAQAVVNYLAARGIPRQIMHPQGFGPLQLLDPQNPASPTNRRVEVVAVH